MMRSIYLKHMGTDARDCQCEWEIDFGKMTLLLKVDFLSPSLLLGFINGMHRYEENLSTVGITGAIAITSRFKTKIDVNGVTYQIRAYKPGLSQYGGQVELELIPIKASES